MMSKMFHVVTKLGHGSRKQILKWKEIIPAKLFNALLAGCIFHFCVTTLFQRLLCLEFYVSYFLNIKKISSLISLGGT